MSVYNIEGTGCQNNLAVRHSCLHRSNRSIISRRIPLRMLGPLSSAPISPPTVCLTRPAKVFFFAAVRFRGKTSEFFKDSSESTFCAFHMRSALYSTDSGRAAASLLAGGREGAATSKERSSIDPPPPT